METIVSPQRRATRWCGSHPVPRPTLPEVSSASRKRWVVNGSTVMEKVDVGAVITGRLNSACALIGTSSNASTSGQTTGPPAENAYAVEPGQELFPDAFL